MVLAYGALLPGPGTIPIVPEPSALALLAAGALSAVALFAPRA